MKIRVKGELTIAEIRQALFEKLHEVEDDLAVRYSMGATLYINPTNGFGEKVEPHTAYGRISTYQRFAVRTLGSNRRQH